jgi:NRPS condensation-like uncharacterized protein
MSDQNFSGPLERFTEYAMAGESDDYPKTDWTQLQFRGPIDYTAISEAYDRAMSDVPIFSCNLREARNGLIYQPTWVFNKDVKNRLIIEDCRHMAGDPFDPMDFSTRFHAHRTSRRINPVREFPLRCFLVRVTDDEHIFSILYHHSVMEPAKAVRMLTTMLVEYHKLVKGKEPQWKDEQGLGIMNRKTAMTTPISLPSFIQEQVTDIFFKNRASTMSGIATRRVLPPAQCKGRISLRHVWDDPKIPEALLKRALKNESSLNDLILAGARKAIAKWNQEHDAKSDKLRFMLITSLRGRMPATDETGIMLAGLNYLADCQSSDIDEQTRHFRDMRKDQLKRGIDIGYHNILSVVVRMLRLLPLKTRLSLVRPIIERMMITFYLSNLGTMWPKMVDGRQTLDSTVLGAGDFEISDIHSSASLTTAVHLGLTTRAHNRRFYLNFVCDRFRFEQDEAKELTDSIVRELENAAG